MQFCKTFCHKTRSLWHLVGLSDPVPFLVWLTIPGACCLATNCRSSLIYFCSRHSLNQVHHIEAMNCSAQLICSGNKCASFSHNTHRLKNIIQIFKEKCLCSLSYPPSPRTKMYFDHYAILQEIELSIAILWFCLTWLHFFEVHYTIYVWPWISCSGLYRCFGII